MIQSGVDEESKLLQLHMLPQKFNVGTAFPHLHNLAPSCGRAYLAQDPLRACATNQVIQQSRPRAPKAEHSTLCSAKVQIFDVPKHVNHAEQLSDENDIPDLLQALHRVRVSGTLRLRAFDEPDEVVRKVLVHLTLGSTEARLNYSSYLRKLATLQRLRCDLHLRLFRP